MSGPILDDSGLGVPDASARALLERMPQAGVLVLDEDLRVLLCEGGAFTQSGWSHDEIRGRRLVDILPAPALAEVEPIYRAALDGRTRTGRYTTPDGRVYRLIASPLTDPPSVFVVTVEATDDARAEDALLESLTLLRTVFDAAPTAMVVFSAETQGFGRVVQANPATSRLLGHALADLQGESLRTVFPPEEAEDVESELRLMATAGGEPEATERRLVDANGRQLWGRLHLSFVHDADGLAQFGVAQIEDVTKERIRDDALRVSKERFGLVFHQAPVGIIMLDLRPGNQGTVLDANEAFCEMVGRAEEELVGLTVRAFTHPEDIERDLATLGRLIRGEIDRYALDKRYLRPDGSVRTARLRVGTVTDDGGRPLYAIGVASDVTELHRAEAARESILESVFEAVIATDGHGRVTVFNRAAEEMFGLEREQALGQPAFDLFVPAESHARFELGMAALWQADVEATVADRRIVRLVRADGTRFPAELSVRRTGRDPVEFSAFVRDLTAERQAERRQRGADELFRTVFADSAVPMAVLSLEGRCLEPNQELCRFLGRTEEELRSLAIADVTHPDDHIPTDQLVAALSEHRSVRREKRFVRGDGEVVWGLAHSSLLHDEHGRPRGIQSQIIDITARRAAAERLGAVLESLAEGVMVVDPRGVIDNVNPAALQMLGYRESELLGREAALLLGDVEGPSAIAEAARLGTAVRVEDGCLVRADATTLPVSYSASPLSTEREPGIVVVFSDISERKARERHLHRRLAALDMLEQTRAALRTGRLVLHSQPILDVVSNTVVQEELLLRMLGPDGELVPPADFLPIAEEYGLIAEIDRWVIGEATQMAAAGRHVEVNVSGKTLGHRDLTRWVEDAMASSGADPRLVTFEITETALTNDLEQAARFAEHVAALGCGFALDDFGTGYGSFTLLKRLPISYLKIDMEFVRNLIDEDADRHVVQAVVSLAQGLGMRTIAEGVEHQETLDLLAELGVDYAQGYLIGRPQPA